ncbi:MAG: CoA-binding protein [Dehalococcoidia bacterium]|nr:CoA-binding protein [Dehalococcoidia bacterium]MCA9843609.1 CoA-binding protein [Dehalococcoidia bacterium]
MNESIDRALLEAKTIAVVGLDSRTFRTSHQIATYLQGAGYRIIPVWFQQEAEEVLGEKAYARVQDIPHPVDLVDVFVRSEQTDRVIDDAIAAGAPAIWLQSGITNDEGLQRAREAGLLTTQDRCTMVEHRKLTRTGAE